MAVLGRNEIKNKVANGDIKINPFFEDNIEPASYDCRLGNVVSAGLGRHEWGDGDEFVLESNSWAAIASDELFVLPKDICASYGITSGIARRGVIAFGGPQIDPGYEGRIFVSLYNPTLEPIVLKHKQIILSVIFYGISSADDEGYTGPYQGQKDFPSRDVEFMMRMRSRNLADVIDNVETLDQSVKTLAENLKILTSDVHEIRRLVNDAKPWVKFIGWILGAAGVAVTGWFAVEILQNFFATSP
ncbi:MAG: hypothetical protein OXH76_10740 [Boseongicola sp.]|nr:hypothetical protein [Boseongicola sp.]